MFAGYELKHLSRRLSEMNSLNSQEDVCQAAKEFSEIFLITLDKLNSIIIVKAVFKLSCILATFTSLWLLNLVLNLLLEMAFL